MADSSLDQWLNEVGFTGGHPFASNEASRETDLLPEFFVDTGQFAAIAGDPALPQTTLIFAPRGGGKTACRMMILQQCRPHDAGADVLAVEHIDWSPLAETARVRRLTAGDHLRAILNSGLHSLMQTLCNDKRLAATLSPVAISRLASFYRRYADELLGPTTVLNCLQAHMPAFNPQWTVFQRKVRARELGDFLAAAGLDNTPTARLLAGLVDEEEEALPEGMSESAIFAEFVRLVRATGLRAVYVLVDRLDEIPETAGDPAQAVALIAPLLANLPLVETPGAAFKCFLPTQLRAALRQTGIVRFDRLRVHDIEWTERALREMLTRRLAAYSEGRHRSLAQISTADLAPIIDGEMVRWGGGTPRRLIAFGEQLFLAHVRNASPGQQLLTEADLVAARRVFLSEFGALSLAVDPQLPYVTLGSLRIELTEQEHRFLKVLQEGDGFAKKEYLADRVWGTMDGVTDEAISQVVRRIREKIEPTPGKPIYLITERGVGFSLHYLAE